MNTWRVGKDSMKLLFQKKNAFYRELDLEDITDKDYTHAQKIFKEFKFKNLGNYHELYVPSDTLLLSDIIGNFRNKYIEIYVHDSSYFLSASGLAWQACLKNTEVENRIIN